MAPTQQDSAGAAVKAEAPPSVKAEEPPSRVKAEEPPASVKAEEPTTVSAASRRSCPISSSAKRESKEELDELSPKRHKSSAGAGGKYGGSARPTPDECRLVHAALSDLHPEVVAGLPGPAGPSAACGARGSVLDSLINTILSQNTTDVNSARAFANLKRAFPSWEAVRTAPAAPIEEAIRSGGLAAIKTARIRAILAQLHAERGECSLEHLRAEPDGAIKDYLRRFKGVGAKTISCVMMFCLGRAEIPVDTHVWKIAIALGWLPKAATRDETYDLLSARVPDGIKYALHVLLVKHGKEHRNDVRVLREALRAAALRD